MISMKLFNVFCFKYIIKTFYVYRQLKSEDSSDTNSEIKYSDTSNLQCRTILFVKEETESKSFLATQVDDFDDNRDFVEISFPQELGTFYHSDSDLGLQLQSPPNENINAVQEVVVHTVNDVTSTESLYTVDSSEILNVEKPQKTKSRTCSESKSTDKILQCEICDKAFEYRASLSNHMRVHKGVF